MDRMELEREVDLNFDAFVEELPEIMPNHAGEYVLMKNGQMVSFHASADAALSAGRAAFADGIYSIQEVTDRPIDLGFFSHAVDPRIA
jgi:hypothetical protein